MTGRALYFHRRRAVISRKVGRLQNGVELQIPAWLGFYYHLRASVVGLTLDLADQYARAPTRIVRTVTGAVDTVSVRLFEPDGKTLTKHKAYALLVSIGDGTGRTASCESLRDGEAILSLDWITARAQARLRLIVDDGESFEQPLTKNRGDPETIDFVRGAGKRPLRLDLPEGDWPHVYIQTGSRVRPLLRLQDDSGYFKVHLLHLVTQDRKLLIPGLSAQWTRVYAIGPDGRVAIAEQRLDPTAFRVLPQQRRLEPISIEELAQRHPETQGFQLRFQVQPPGLSEDQWLEAGVASWSRQLHNPPIVWRKFVTSAVPYRFILRTDDDRSERVIDLGR